jgi:hypothetical protein
MWKSIVLCVSLFGGAALGLTLGARFVEPAALPAAAAIGLCVIGVVLILAAPTVEQETIEETQLATKPLTTQAPQVMAAQEIEPLDIPTVATVANRTPTMPFEALNS